MKDNIIQLGGSYHKKCPCGCETEFFGRRNQKYLNNRHKAKFNNEKKAVRNEEIGPILAQIENNYHILKKYYPKSKNTKIVLSLMLKEGFHPNAPHVPLKIITTGKELRSLGKYCFRMSEDNQFITINQFNYGSTTK